jgi:hypothetical protein
MADCSICLNEEIEDLDKCKNNCGHVFCKTCLDNWLNRGNDDCPLCRQKIEYFEYRNEKYRLINISRQINPLSRVQTVFRTHPNLLLVVRVIGLIVSVGLLLQAYFVYSLQRENNKIKSNCEREINIYKEIINNLEPVRLLNSYGRYINCFMPKYFVNKCFNT